MVDPSAIGRPQVEEGFPADDLPERSVPRPRYGIGRVHLVIAPLLDLAHERIEDLVELGPHVGERSGAPVADGTVVPFLEAELWAALQDIRGRLQVGPQPVGHVSGMVDEKGEQILGRPPLLGDRQTRRRRSESIEAFYELGTSPGEGFEHVLGCHVLERKGRTVTASCHRFWQYLRQVNRTERLYGLVETLREAGEAGCNVASLASRFEVSTRTVKRDIAALQQVGLPIWAQPGPGGGYRLLASNRRLPPVRFTAGEAAAVAVALNTQADLPFATEGNVALSKILGALEAGSASPGVHQLLGRVWTTTAPHRTAAARVLDTAIATQKVVVITYVDGEDVQTTRKVDPLQFAHTGGYWYLLGYCHLRQDGRWFRLDRIKAARLLSESAPFHEVSEVIGQPPPEARPLA